MRMTEMAQVKKPRQKTPSKAIFWFLRRLSRAKAGSGTTKMVTSVTMLPAALMYQKGRLGMHVPGTWGCQNFSMGEQLKMVTRSCEMAQRATKTPAIMITRRICGVPRMRQYWRRKVILVAVRDAL